MSCFASLCRQRLPVSWRWRQVIELQPGRPALAGKVGAATGEAWKTGSERGRRRHTCSQVGFRGDLWQRDPRSSRSHPLVASRRLMRVLHACVTRVGVRWRWCSDGGGRGRERGWMLMMVWRSIFALLLRRRPASEGDVALNASSFSRF